MKDIFDEILQLLPSSTLEILKQHKTDSEHCGHKLEQLLNETLDIQNKQTERELQRKCIDVNSKLNEDILIYRKKLKEAQCKYECFEDFPPNMAEAKKAIDDIRERIKKHDKDINSLF
ncbi:hypothetical protein Phum_PHUM335440 [Pediculus humanus corporis]|uniref:Uncharacterized protein n=1 Tax=Pediculus humanus subsp. corporis TaxID=121224 RepID=E0VNJ3_PEDHC|nr:uncharacterized protein Phum_PHUM335440 [Pediculus humanus corporis]EEB14949.1 hypothetical protein Phum_PHUM335440 [Pediculus humanus corporis]